LNVKRELPKVGLAAAGLVVGVVLASTVGANAASPSPTPTSGTTSSGTAADPHPGDNGADGVPESQEHHGGHGLDLSGTVAAVGTDTVTIGSKTYKVASTSDIDKNGESTLSKLAQGDAVTFSLESDGVTIDKLHAGNEAQDAPNQSTATTPGTTSSGT
jgi:hypothetical protein